jgi:dipeptidyl aminopeptidase/acylaminoacyl peptidase
MNAQASVRPSERRPTPELLIDVRTPSEIDIAPDGATIAFSLHATVSEHGVSVPSDLWMIRSDGSQLPLTDGAWADRSPVWSPDGSRLAFLSDRRTSGHRLPYTMEPGSAAVLAGTFRGSAESVRWSSDGDRLLVLAADPGSFGLEWSAVAVTGEEADPDPDVHHPAEAWRRLYLIDLTSGAVDEAGPVARSVWEVDWDGEGTVVALVSEEPTGSGWYRSVVARLDLDARTAETLYTPSWQLEGLALSPDGARAAIVEGYSSDHGMLSGSVMIVDLAGGRTRDPWPGLETVGLVQWCDAGSLWYSRYDSTRTACGRIGLDGDREELWSGPAFIGPDITKPSCVVANGGTTVLTTHQGHGLAPELARFDVETTDWVRFTGFNDAITADTAFPTLREVSWSAPGGLQIDGLLLTPRGANGPLPLLALVHGGPSWCWAGYFSDSEPNSVLLADAGYACLLPNPRGSNGRGHAFSQAVIGDPGGRDFQDILAGVDMCVETGIADPDRLGISGLSYGGYMTAWAVTQTDRFAAAVAQSVISNWTSFHLTSDISAFDDVILGGNWDDPSGPYPRWSPVFHAGIRGCTTPTLIVAGRLDRCTPVGQAEELFAAIAAAGAETELVVYPREGHVPMERAHALDSIRRTQAWFDRHLRATVPQD